MDQGGYYTLDGSNLRKAFLRSPLEFSRMTSGFTLGALPSDIAIVARAQRHGLRRADRHRVKATADGVVDFAGVQGGYGNVVVLRHQSKYTTCTRICRALQRAYTRAQAAQGDVIGYVGMTGMATGPHVHYEFRINDVHQDPLSVAMPQSPSTSHRN